MEEPGFWDNADRATKLVQEAKNLKDTVDLYVVWNSSTKTSR